MSTKRTRLFRARILTLAMILALVLSIMPQAIPGVETPTAEAHNLQTRMVSMYLDTETQALLDARMAAPGWTPPDPLLQAGDELGLVIKVVPRDGTTTGVGGHVDFYVPNGVQVTDVGYLVPDGTGGFIRVAMKGQSPIAVGDGPIGAKSTSQLIGLGTNYTNINGVTEAPVVTGSGLHRGTIAGVYGDTGIFYATDPDTAYGSWQRFTNDWIGGGADRCGSLAFTAANGETLVNNSGDTVVPCNKWDAEQLMAWGVKGGSYGASAPIVDYGDGRGNAPWGFAAGAGGPQSGYAWNFDWDEWQASPKTAADMRNAMGNDEIGPWNRVQYDGDRVSFDQPGLESTELGFASIDAGNLGATLPLPPTTDQTTVGGGPKAIRWAVGQLTAFRPEFVWVKIKVNSAAEITDPSGCPLFKADTFGGDAGGTDNGKDHLWRYYEPTEATWNGCLAAQKPATREIVKVGDTYQYKLKIYNMQNFTLSAVVARDTLPGGVQFISAVPAQNSGPNPLVWNVGTLLPGQKWEATVTVKATGSGYLDNCMVVSSGQLPDQTVCESTISGSFPYLVPAKTVQPQTIVPGGTVQYTVLVKNTGTGPSSSPTLINEFMEPGFTYLSKDSVLVNGADYTATTTVNSSNPTEPIFTVPAAINAGQSLILKFTAQVGANVLAGEYCNTFSVVNNGVPITTGSQACLNVGGSAIGDTLFRDWNGNGIQDPEDEGMNGVVVNLYAGACTAPPSGTVIQSEATNASGNYLFDGLTAGTYCVQTVYPSGYTVTADPDGGANGYATVTLPTDTSQNFNQDFGFQPGGAGIIGDKVFDDQNQNGVFDAGDVGINGATVYLYEDSNGNGVIDPGDYLVGTQTTAGGGTYNFTGLAQDLDYLVQVIKTDAAIDAYFPNPYAPSTPLLIPVPNLSGNFDEADFGFFTVVPSSIGDTVCIDVDTNGLCTGADTPIAGVEVKLYQDTNGNGVLDPGEPLFGTQVTNGSGIYTFIDLPPGDYIVDVTQDDPDVPGGYAASRDLIPVAIVTPGTTYVNADFPFVQTLRKEVNPTGPANAGNTLTYSLFPNYSGSELLTDVEVADPIPAGSTYVAVSVNAGGAFSANTVQWNLGSNLAAIPGNTVGSFYCPAGPATAVASKDTYLDSNDVNANYGSENVIKIDSDKVFDGLVQFTLPTLPGGAVFDRAELQVTVDGGQNASRTVSVHKLIKGPWTEGTSNNTCTTQAAWQGPNCTDDWLSAGGNFGTSDYAATVLGTISPALNNTTYAVDVSSAYLDWVATPASNYGLALIATGSDTGEVSFDSRTGDPGEEPTLAVYYSLPVLGGCTETVKIYPQQDNYINADKPNEVKNGTELLTKIDTDPAKVIRSLLQFNLSTLPAGATITAASFKIFATGTANQTVNIRALTNGWNETQATWNNRLTGTPWTTAGADFAGTAYGSFVPNPTNNVYYSTNVLSLVQAWYGGTVTNNGLILVPSGANSQAKYGSRTAVGKEPYLEITYQSPFVTTDLIATQDAYIEANSPNANNSGTELRTKYDTDIAKRSRALVQFDLSTIPAGAVVDDAHFYINVKSTAAHTLNVRRLTSVWNEAQVTWNNRVTATPWTTAGGDTAATVYGTFAPNAIGYVNTDVTPLAQGWFANSFANDGMILIPVSGSNSEARYNSSEVVGKEPFLRVRYQAPSAGGTRSNNMSARGTLVTGGSTVKVQIVLRSEAAVSNVTPGTITPSGVNGASAVCGSPALISADDDIAAASFSTDPVIFEWTCTTTAGATPGSVKFSATASGDAGATTFAAATTNTVLVSPILQFQVTVDSPILVEQIENTGNIQSGGSQSYTQLTPNLCYVASDLATDTLYTVATLDGAAALVGPTGATGTADLHGMAWNLAGTKLYGANGNQLGTFNAVFSDPASAAFTNLPNTIASVGTPMRGSLGNFTVANVVGISFDPVSGNLYGVHRREDGNTNNTLLDVLIQIDALTGKVVQNAFGAGVDYVVIGTFTLPTALYNISDISFHPTTGDLYAIANDSTASVDDLDRLVIINKVTGAVTDVGRLTNTADATGVNDMQGLSFLNAGNGVFLYGTTASAPPTSAVSNRFWEIDPATAAVSEIASLSVAHNDYESIACLPGDFEITTIPPVIPLTPSNEVITPLPTGTIGDFVWFDNNRNQAYDPGAGETPIAGAIVLLYVDANNNGILDPINGDYQVGGPATTDVNGLYQFTGLPPGAYLVDVYEDSITTNGIRDIVPTTDDVQAINLPSGQTILTADFGYYEGARVQGSVFHDADRNGVFDDGETGLDPVTVTLIGTDNFGNPISLTTTTDPDGHFVFIVPEGDYTLTYNTTQTTGLGYPEATTPTSFTFHAYPGEDWQEVFDFGVDNAGKIGDFVWNDTNNNGQQDGSEPGIGGVTMRLYLDADGNLATTGDQTLVATTLTDGAGAYQFPGLPNTIGSQAYVVQVETATLPAGYTPTGEGQPGTACASLPGGVCDNQIATSLTGGATINTLDFGYKAPPTSFPVSGRVWNDTDGNGSQNGGELGIPNVSVCLRDTNDNIVACTTTNATGDYTFPGVPNGSYTIVVDPDTLPNDAYVQTGDPNAVCPSAGCDDQSPIVVNGAPVTNQNFGYQQQLSSITGTICDGNGNGDCNKAGDPAEPAIASVIVFLTWAGPDGIMGTADDVVTTTTTDGSGNYSFPNLLPGVYAVTKVTPAGFSSLADIDGSNPNYITVNLAAGQNKTNQDFEVDPLTGAIGDRVWLDTDGDGVQDIGEPGLPNVVVELKDGSGNQIDSDPNTAGVQPTLQTTDINGNYLFTNVPAGNYRVDVVSGVPANVVAAPGTTDPHLVTLVSGQSYLDADFGYVPATGTAVIGDYVWADANSNGIQDPGEIGIGGVTVQLRGPGPDGIVGTGDDTTVATVPTDPDGSYLFTNVAPGQYLVRVSGAALTGYTPTSGPQSEGATTSAPVSVVGGDVLTDVDFGFYKPGLHSISDLVWYDADSDGVLDTGESGIGGVTVNLLDNLGNVIATTITSPDGTFTFPGVPNGSYTIQISDNTGQLTGLQTTTAPAGAGELPVVVAGSDLIGTNFGYTGLGPIGDTVFSDHNGNGVQDPGELGIGGVTVKLFFDSNNNGVFNSGTDPLIATTPTDASGAYLFNDLPPGTFFVSIGQPQAALTGYTSTTTDEEPAIQTGSTSSVEIAATLSTAPVSVDVVDAGLDMNGDNAITAADTGQAHGVQVIAGKLDLNGDGSVTAADDGWWNGVRVIDGQLDADGNGSISIADDGSVTIKQIAYLHADFGYQNTSLAEISGSVWNDINRNARDDGVSEPPIPGVTVALVDSNGNVIATTTTDANGAYTFFDVPAGNYKVVVTDDANVLSDYVLTSGLDEIPVTVVGTTPVTNVDFGYVRSPDTGSIGDTIWHDANKDGVQNGAEGGIANVTVRLYGVGPDGVIGGGDDPLIDSTVTDSDGKYLFDALDSGKYYVQVDPTTLPNGGTNLTETTGGNDNRSGLVSLPEGVTYLDADLGYASSTGSALGDFVWHDVNGDGIQDPGEPGIGGVTLTVTGPSCPSGCVVVTDPDGSWLLTNLSPGNYTVNVTPPVGYSTYATNGPTIQTFTVLAGQDWLDADFGFDNGPAGSIGDTVWLDVDGNGTQGGSEPGIPGVTVVLIRDSNNNGIWDSGEPIIATDVTNANGLYQFAGLPTADGTGTDDYLVRVSDTNNVLAGLPGSYDSDGAAGGGGGSQANSVYGLSRVQDLTATAVTNQDFGYAPIGGSIGNQLWHDLNGNGTRDAGEPGMQGVLVNLWLDVDGDGVYDAGLDNLVRQAVTDINGQYEFLGMPAGKYLVDVASSNLASGGVLEGFALTDGPNDGQNDNSQVDPYVVTLTISGGVVSSNYTADFGYTAPGAGYTISGTAFGDLNNNGGTVPTQEAGEPPVAGATALLYRDLDGDGNLDPGEPLIGSATTDSNGNYQFTDLPDGDYIVVIDATGTYVDGYQQTTQTGASNPVQPVTLAGADSPDNDFGFYRPESLPGTIGDRVWLDENGNGLQDAGEDGIANVKVTVTKGAETYTTYTDANGDYVFSGLSVGNWIVTVDPASLPAGLAANPTYDENGTGTPHTTTVALTSGEEHMTADFGYNWAPTSDVTGNTGTGAIGDRVWADVNGNGVQDPGEAGLGGVSVELVTAGPDGLFGTGDDVVAGTTTTNANGNYMFDGLAAGSYVVRIPTSPAGYTQTGDPDGTLDSQTTQPIVLAPGDVFVEADFGYAPQDGLPNSIGDTVWLDVDRDGVQDAGEAGIGGVTVQLTWAGPDGNLATTADNVVYTTVTDDNGQYLFSDLPDGNFQVTTNLPSNTGAGGPLEGLFAAYDASGSLTDGTSDVSLDPTHLTTNAVTNLAQDFGYSPNDGAGNEGLIGDTIFFDANGNGVADPGEGIPGVDVILSGAASAVATTDANGLYIFAGLAAGSYVVTVDTGTLPAGLTNSVDPNGGNNNTAAVTLATNTTVNLNQDFGYTGAADPLPNSIGDTVWLDVDRDGVQDAGEAGIGGVLVQLTWYGPDGVAGGGDDVVYTTVTDVNGGYLFTDLPDGNFQVTTNLPSNTGPGGPLEGLFAAYDASGSQTDGTSDVSLDPTHLTTGPVTNLAQDFGYSPNDGIGNEGLIGDTIFFDANGNGVADPGEGIPGVKVTLDGSTVTTTDANGNYTFGGLAAGSHTVVVDPATLPAGLTNTFDPDGGTANQSTVILATNQVRMDQDFGYQSTTLQLSSIGDTVWVDANRDNARNAGEPGIPGVTVALIKDLDGDGTWDAGEPIIATDTTDANGQYSFGGLPTGASGDYLVWVNDTANVLSPLVATYDVRDGANQGDPASGVVTGFKISAVTNLTATPVTNADFAFAPLGHDAGEGLIGDTIYLDRNGNLTPDAGEGLEGVEVQLYAANGTTLLETTYTNENGQYFFGGLNPTATYVVKVNTGTLPAGLTNTVDPDGGTANQSTVNLATTGPINLNQDFGYDGANTISGTIWQDTDAGGLLDGGEGGRWAGVTVTLYDADGNVVATTTTDANGNYSFGNLPDGTFKVDVTDDANVLNGTWKSTGPTPGADNNSQTDPYTVTVSGGQTNTTADFGYYNAPAGLGNYAWDDANKNGIQDVGESGLGGVLVTLTITWPSGGGTTIVKTTTDASGYYSFGNLLLDENMDGVGAGEPTFTIAVATPSTYTPTLANQGGNDALDSDPSGVTATTREGTVNTIYDFGFYRVVPDVTPVITAVPNVMTGITNFNIFVKVTELLVVPTNGLITVRIPKDTRWVLDGPYDSTLTVLGGTPVNNPVWAYSQNATQHIFTTTATIPAGGFSTFGFKALWDAGQTQGVYTITSQIDSFSGGENRIDNNSDAEKLDYFIN